MLKCHILHKLKIIQNSLYELNFCPVLIRADVMFVVVPKYKVRLTFSCLSHSYYLSNIHCDTFAWKNHRK